MQIAGRTIFITGGGGGIGGGMAQAFAEQGGRIILADIDAGFAEAEAAKLPAGTDAMALPIEALVKDLPLGAITPAPALRQRSASRMSAVMQSVSAPARSAIQSSAASNPSLTTTRSINSCAGMRIGLLLTMVTGTPWRKATL